MVISAFTVLNQVVSCEVETVVRKKNKGEEKKYKKILAGARLLEVKGKEG